MRVSEVGMVSCTANGISHKSNIGKAILVSAMMSAPQTAAQMQTLDKDMFEKSPKTEYVTEPNNDFVDSVYVVQDTQLKGNKERGEKFNKWFWDMVFCANKDGSFNAERLNGASLYFKFPEKDYQQLAADIISTFDQNGDYKVNIHEYGQKSRNLVEQKVGQALSTDLTNQFYDNYFIPWFKGFDYDGKKDVYNVNELAATLYALDRFSSSTNAGKGYIRGDKLLFELGYVMDNGYVDECFERGRTDYYINNNLSR